MAKGRVVIDLEEAVGYFIGAVRGRACHGLGLTA